MTNMNRNYIPHKTQQFVWHGWSNTHELFMKEGTMKGLHVVFGYCPRSCAFVQDKLNTTLLFFRWQNNEKLNNHAITQPIEIKITEQNGKAHEDVFKFKATRNQKYTMHDKKKNKQAHKWKKKKFVLKTTPGSAISHTSKRLIIKNKNKFKRSWGNKKKINYLLPGK